MSARAAAALLHGRLRAAWQASSHSGTVVRGLAAAAEGGGAGPPPVLPPLQRQGGGGVAQREPVVTNVVEKAGDPWSEVTVRDTGEVYYWNRVTGETTAVGEPRPTAAGRLQQQAPQYEQPLQGQGLGLGRLLAMGAGVGLAFGLLGKLLGG